MDRATLSEARARTVLIARNLPKGIDPAAFRTKEGKLCLSKAPTIALIYREAQIWRIEEFARASCDAFERRDLIVAAACSRHAAECCAGVWYLRENMKSHMQSGIGHDDLYEKLGKLYVGAKSIPDMPEAINVLTMINLIDKEIPGFRRTYDRLSEISHPNWAGSVAMFSKRDADLITWFGRDLRDATHTEDLILNTLTGSLGLFEHAYNDITDMLPEFIEACEKEFGR